LQEPESQATADYQQQKTRLTELQADLLGLRLARMEGELISAVAVDNAWADSVLRTRAVLLGLPPRLSAQINQADNPHAVTQIIAQGIDDALTELAEPVTYEDNLMDSDLEEIDDENNDESDDEEDKYQG